MISKKEIIAIIDKEIIFHTDWCTDELIPLQSAENVADKIDRQSAIIASLTILKNKILIR